MFCVSNATELQDALDVAAINGEDDQIRLRPGVYRGTFRYSANVPNGDVFDIEIVGGYSALLNPCFQPPSNDPSQTVLDAEGMGRVLFIRGNAGTEVTVRNVSLINGDATADNDPRGGGVYILGGGRPGLDHVRFENNLVRNNTASLGAGVYFEFVEFFEFTNNVVDINSATFSYAVSIANDRIGGHVINNTLINNSAPAGNDGGLFLSFSDGAQGLVVNNILWANTGRHLSAGAANDDELTVVQNTIGPQDLAYPDNLSIAPEFAGGRDDYGLVASSPLIDVGARPQPFSPPIPFSEDWSLPEQDLVGKPRIIGVTVDIGAVETIDQLFVDSFES